EVAYSEQRANQTRFARSIPGRNVQSVVLTLRCIGSSPPKRRWKGYRTGISVWISGCGVADVPGRECGRSLAGIRPAAGHSHGVSSLASFVTRARLRFLEPAE